jgi:S-DNA-T family DNA segregation ATPase FtsK/SpoIIIE
VVLAIVYMVRYARADAEMRRSIRLAWYVRFTWRRLSRMVGLAVIQPASGQVVGRRSSGGSGVSSGRLRVPRIRVRPDAYGVVLSVRTLPRIGREEWVKAADHLANAWGCVRVAVTQERPGRLVVRAVRRDPLAEAYELVPSGRPPATLARWDIGRDEYAEAVAVRLADVPGISVSGLPGYGKTSLLNNLIASFAPSDAVQFAVVDGKGGADYEDLRDRFFAWSADDLKDANELFKRMYELRRVRSEYVRSLLGVKNMWHVGPSRSWPLVVLVIDEAHTFLADIKGDRELAMLAADNRRLVEDIVKKGRSVGMVTVLATQKSTGGAPRSRVRRRGFDGGAGPAGLRAGPDAVRQRRARGSHLHGDGDAHARSPGPGGGAAEAGSMIGPREIAASARGGDRSAEASPAAVRVRDGLDLVPLVRGHVEHGARALRAWRPGTARVTPCPQCPNGRWRS